MDFAADGLLALSNTAAEIANDTASMDDDDDRSSSLSELEDAPENPELEDLQSANLLDADSEAETERIDESPDKSKRTTFEISPSKLIQSITADERPEIEALTNSEVSSPISPLDDSPTDSEPSDDEEVAEAQRMREMEQTKKRKRLSDGMEAEDINRARRRRTGSVESDEDKSDGDESDVVGARSRGHTAEPGEDGLDNGMDSSKEDDLEETGQGREPAEIGGPAKIKKPSKAMKTKRLRSLRGKDAIGAEGQDLDEENELGEGSEDDVDADDVDAAAKSEEEQATRAAAMEALVALERHFATLRDKLYDEKLTQIKHELEQLAQPKACHPELLRQLDCVHKFRNEKFEIEQKLLVYKVGALKTKSVAERSQIHSAYFQSVRDIREKHMERISEHFYRIQKERFKSAQIQPSYTIPFPERRSQQILQQTAYNKEVSILSGIAKYRGFPAAPELPGSRNKELEADVEKMGITLHPPRALNPAQRQMQGIYNPPISGPAAEEQFLEQTPWANPQHPIHRLGMSRQASDRSPKPESYLTPASQQRVVDTSRPVGSSSTIVENLSAPVSSAVNTPYEPQNNLGKPEQQTNGVQQNYRIASASPLDARIGSRGPQRTKSARPPSQPREMPEHQPSSPLQARASLLVPPRHTGSAQADMIPTAGQFIAVHND